MLITFACDHCRASLEVDAAASGTRIDCPSCKRSLTVPAAALGPGTVLGGFRIEEELGHGGMGIVFRARQLSMDRDVALKILRPEPGIEPEDVDRFLNEVRMAARLEHPHIVTAYEAGVDGGRYYMAMAYIKGQALDRRIQREGALDRVAALTIARGVAQALDYAWREHRLMHRDIKPSNIMLDARGEPKLTDLGLSHRFDPAAAATPAETLAGTPNYMSPERMEDAAAADFRTDMYSLGATLYHMLTARVPFAGNQRVQAMRLDATDALPDPRTINPAVTGHDVHLLSIMLARAPDRRHPSWEKLVADIDRVLAGHAPARARVPPGESLLHARETDEAPATAAPHKHLVVDHARLAAHFHPHEAEQSPAARRARRRARLTAAVVFVLACAVVGGGFLWQMQRDRARLRAESAKLRRLETQLHAALDYRQEHREDFDGAAARLAEVRAAAAGTRYAREAAEALALLEKERAAAARAAEQQAAEAALADLRQRAEALVESGDGDAALALVNDYNGPQAAALAEPRAALAESLRQQIAARAAREAQSAKDAAERRAATLAGVADDVLQGNLAAARDRLAAAAGGNPPAERAAEIASMRQQIEGLAGVPGRIMDTYRADIGKEITLGTVGGELTLKITGVEGDRLRAVKVARDGARVIAEVARDVAYAELSDRERVQRLGRLPGPEADIAKGLIAHGLKADAKAAEFFQHAGTSLGRALADRLAPPAAEP